MAVLRIVIGKKAFVAALLFLLIFIVGDTSLRHRELQRVTNIACLKKTVGETGFR